MLRVVKIGGRAQGSPALPAALAGAWRAAPGALCLVHGGGDEISALQRATGAEPHFVGGRRVTTDADLELIRMALSGAANKRLVSALVTAGVPALGLSGEDAALLVARPAADTALGALGAVGTPERVDVRLLGHLLAGGFCPVLSPLARRAGEWPAGTPGALNVNGDDAAAAIAVALGADELLLVADVAGVVVDDRPVPWLDPDDAARLVALGVARGGMAAKLDAACAALEGGVARVRIGDVDAIADLERGTILTPSGSAVA